MSLESAVRYLLPDTTSFVEIQRDAPFFEHPPHVHKTDEKLLIIEGEITFRIGSEVATCRPGDCLDLPQGTVHSSTAGPDGCVYVISTNAWPL